MGDWVFEEKQFTCPHCGQSLIIPIGDKNSPFLIIKEYPDKDEIANNKPLSGSIGAIFKQELFYLGENIYRFRITTLWLHRRNKNELCYNYGLEQAIKEAKGRKAILLLGSEALQAFTNEVSIKSSSGLLLESHLVSTSIIMSCQNPSKLFYSPAVGDFRFALKQFVKQIQEIEC